MDRNDVTIEEFSKYFGVNVTGNADEAGSYTCLRIKYKIDKYGKIFFQHFRIYIVVISLIVNACYIIHKIMQI